MPSPLTAENSMLTVSEALTLAKEYRSQHIVKTFVGLGDSDPDYFQSWELIRASRDLSALRPPADEPLPEWIKRRVFERVLENLQAGQKMLPPATDGFTSALI